ncbi:GIY-YIG nuclease family protein [Corynebacterium sp. MSK044]|uniref:GIY-YIG nuclease family protein n=1 Tax=Corynebacterium sp. MSK044 TaxID=3050195 RepID=UPI00254FA72F|nr:GIY-YIG nuclease family protein [Corynebacterium sp. MSK044]MDK8797583.1 GIY-YIG nuclease family protein [Corynebacterium sp. MSK044]
MRNSNQHFIADFKLSITKALADQLHATLQQIDTATLEQSNVDKLEARSGVYELFESEGDSLTRVYVGKAKSDLRSRLNQHRIKISGRKGICLQDIEFKAVYVDEDLDAAAPEKMLIDHYRKGGSVPWNTNGFGNKDPGRNRDKTIVKGNHFDALYPINLEYPLDEQEMGLSENAQIESALSLLKRATPFTIRFQSHPDLDKPFYLLPHSKIPQTIKEWITAIFECLPEGWQATALPGYVIIYKETQTYSAASHYWYRNREVAFNHAAQPSFE